MEELDLTDLKEALSGFAAFVRDELTPRVLICAGVGLTTLIVGIIILRKINSNPPVSKKVRRAMEMGHAVQGNLVKILNPLRTRDKDERTNSGIYEYVVNGQTYQYRYVGREALLPTRTIYYLDNPKRGFIQESREAWRTALLLAVTFLVFVLTVYLTKSMN